MAHQNGPNERQWTPGQSPPKQGDASASGTVESKPHQAEDDGVFPSLSYRAYPAASSAGTKPNRPNVGLMLTQLACAGIGLFVGLFVTEILILDVLQVVSLRDYNNKSSLIGGLILATIFGAVPGLFWKKK